MKELAHVQGFGVVIVLGGQVSGTKEPGYRKMGHQHRDIVEALSLSYSQLGLQYLRI